MRIIRIYNQEFDSVIYNPFVENCPIDYDKDSDSYTADAEDIEDIECELFFEKNQYKPQKWFNTESLSVNKDRAFTFQDKYISFDDFGASFMLVSDEEFELIKLFFGRRIIMHPLLKEGKMLYSAVSSDLEGMDTKEIYNNMNAEWADKIIQFALDYHFDKDTFYRLEEKQLNKSFLAYKNDLNEIFKVR